MIISFKIEQQRGIARAAASFWPNGYPGPPYVEPTLSQRGGLRPAGITLNAG